MDKINLAIEKFSPKNCLIAGAGYIGIEMAENLHARGIKVEIAAKYSHTMPVFDPEMTVDFEDHMVSNGITLHYNSAVQGFFEETDRIVAELGNSRNIESDIVIFCVGVRPDVHLAKNSGLKIGELGGISVDKHLLTSDPDIYAAGDAIEVFDFVSKEPALIPLAGPANRQGRIVADNIFGRNSVYDSSLGTAIVKIFNMTAACVGLTEKKLKKKNIPYRKIYLHPNSHAGYYPGATQINLKLMFSPENGKILGVQIVGYEGVDKRIDVIATAMKAGLTVFDLESLELSYAPPYGSAKDPVNMAGFIASNLMRGDVEFWYPEDYPCKTVDGLIIDVRPKESFEIGHIPGAINIPISELRNNLEKIPKDKDLFLYCRVGFNSYLAYRVLVHNGFGKEKKISSLSGGYTTFIKFHKPAGGNSDNLPPINKTSGKEASMRKNQKNEDITIDACGLQCPGPIMKIKEAFKNIPDGSIVKVIASDPGFAHDINAWCSLNNCEVLEISGTVPRIEAIILKNGTNSCSANATFSNPDSSNRNLTLVVFSGDLDKVLAAFVISNGALAMGKKVTLFFTFWGLNSLRKNLPQSSGKSVLDYMFGEMMPKGPNKLALSKMDMCGIGTYMMKHVMKSKNVESLQTMMDSAIKGGARLVACSMSMNVMGLKKEELIDGIEIGGVATFLAESDKSSATLFI